MSIGLAMRNRYLQILVKNGVSQANISRIMNDVDGSGIFDDYEVVDDDMEGYYEDEAQAEMEFSGLSVAAKKEKFGGLKDTKRSLLQQQNENIFRQRFNAKVAEMAEELEKRGIVEFDEIDVDENKSEDAIRYGRNKLHEAIALRDLGFVKALVESEPDLLTGTDNNGHTPLEMAYYEGFEEAYKFLNIKLQLLAKT